MKGYNLIKLKVDYCKSFMLYDHAKVDMKMNNWYQLCFDQCGNDFKVNTVTSEANFDGNKTIVSISNFPLFYVKGNYFVLIFCQHTYFAGKSSSSEFNTKIVKTIINGWPLTRNGTILLAIYPVSIFEMIINHWLK